MAHGETDGMWGDGWHMGRQMAYGETDGMQGDRWYVGRWVAHKETTERWVAREETGGTQEVQVARAGWKACFLGNA